ncbi:hypothetical protein MMC17_008427 [Xylographa soralifera]|nr:hypothetical protein [Xylographa soralifera]
MSEGNRTSSGSGARQVALTNTIPIINESNGLEGNLIEASVQGAIGTADTSELDLQKLQEYIKLLQAKALRFEAIQKEQAPFRYQVLYRLKQPELKLRKDRNAQGSRLSLPFFDHPEWVRGQDDMRYVQCNLPLTNFELYLEKNKDISFIVYLDFDPTLDSILAKHGTNKSGVQGDHLPNFTSETIRPVAEYLVNAIKTLLESREEYAGILREYNASYELLAPYLFMYHSQKNLDDIQTGLSEPARKQLSILSDYVSKQYGHIYRAADSLLSQGSISHNYIQYLFKPGDVLVARRNGHYTAHVATSWPRNPETITVSSTHAKSFGNGTRGDFYSSKDTPGKMQGGKVKIHRYRVDAWHWAFDGNFQQKHEVLLFDIPFDRDESTTSSDVEGSGTTGDKENSRIIEARRNNIAELNLFPIQYASDEIVARLRRRGRTFWNCRKRRFISYSENDKDDIHNLAEEWYMVDLKTWRSLHPENSYSSKPLVDELGPEAMERDDPPDEQFELLLPLEIKGYNLRRKKWFDLVSDRIYDVKWNREAFQTLVIDPKARDLIRALVSNQLATEKSTDLIAGKGNGLIMLLHGGPGTGKTLTAESVAEIAEKPLYRVTCGDVGTKVEDVERYLDSVLHLGKIWGCVVLLDEADVVLEQRSLEDLERNALVSVFLRVLEYYEGILVLTSNRVGTFDEAFKSRIQLALHYPTLGPFQRLRIWETFIQRLESFGDDAVDIADLRDHLEDLKEEKMNGGQIRNAITMARQYAEWKKKHLKLRASEGRY